MKLDKEIELVSIDLSPAPVLWNSGLKKPLVKVFNHGLSNVNREFICEIKKGNTMLYSNKQSVNLLAGVDTWISFDSTYNALDVGDIQLRAYVLNHLDINSINDTVESTINVPNYHDIEMKRILKPIQGQVLIKQNKTLVEVELKNNGNAKVQTNVYFLIHDSLNNLISTNNVLLELNPLETKVASSDSLQLTNNVRTYFCTVYQNNSDAKSNNDTIKTKFYREKSLKVDGLEKEIEFEVYPNPFENKVVIDISSEYKEGRIELYDVNGKLIKSEKVEGNRTILEIDNCESSIYLLKICIDNQLFIKKIIKQ